MKEFNLLEMLDGYLFKSLSSPFVIAFVVVCVFTWGKIFPTEFLGWVQVYFSWFVFVVAAELDNTQRYWYKFKHLPPEIQKQFQESFESGRTLFIKIDDNGVWKVLKQENLIREEYGEATINATVSKILEKRSLFKVLYSTKPFTFLLFFIIIVASVVSNIAPLIS